MKFGGSTLSDINKINNCANKIISKFNDYFPIVVVSAMGDTTQNLSNLISKITSQPTSLVDSANPIMSQYNQHANSIKSTTIQSNIATDLILSTGEMVSAGMLSLSLNAKNYKSQPVCGWQMPMITNSNHGSAKIEKLSKNYINSLIQNQTIPIITGFQGVSPANNITTLGKEGSDLTAVALADQFNAHCYIYKSVDGVFTCDPNSNPGQKINQLSYDNMQIASEHGAQVIYHRAVKYAKKHNVKIFIQSAFTKANGTTISNSPSNQNIITKQRAFLTILNQNNPIPNGHAFISYDQKWCLFSNQKELQNYLEICDAKIQNPKHIKITLIHPQKIIKENFIQIAKKYSSIYSCMESYSWICVQSKHVKDLERELHIGFI
ncbi:aspartate kinase [Candidatus Cytomitobacter primus]|nr:aspartate kinase [Candidatus Cytomitobacter primus]